MVKKLFALASVSALAGLMASVSAAGCSSTEESPGGETSKDASTDSKKPPVTNPSDADTEEPNQCWKDDALDVSDYPYKKARVQAGACTDKVFDVWDEIGKNDKATWDDLKAAIAKDESEKCAACIFGAAEDVEEWAPIIGDVEKGTYTYNLGGCVEVVSGKAACGKAFAAANACIESACADCSDDEASDCQKAVVNSACADAVSALNDECGANLDAYIKACGSGEDLVTSQCIGESKDAGNDN